MSHPSACPVPSAAPHPCSEIGCPALITRGSRCERHQAIVNKAEDQARLSSNERGYTGAWRKARAGWLRKHPLCQCPDCDDGRKRMTLASVVDHIIPHKGDMTLFWDSENNWQSMSAVCHNRKTARER